MEFTDAVVFRPDPIYRQVRSFFDGTLFGTLCNRNGRYRMGRVEGDLRRKQYFSARLGKAFKQLMKLPL